MTVQRRFPVLLECDGRFRQRPGGDIPWDAIAPHAEVARVNHFQSLEQLAARGGLNPVALLHVLLDVVYSTDPDSRALQALGDDAALERVRELVGEPS